MKRLGAQLTLSADERKIQRTMFMTIGLSFFYRIPRSSTRSAADAVADMRGLRCVEHMHNI